MDVREKLEVIAHLGDHITYKEDIGICYDNALAKVIEDAYMTLKNGATVQRWTEGMRMATCKDCLHIDVCYMVEHYGVDIEENMQENDCHQFQDRTKYEKVVRCKDCKSKIHDKASNEDWCNNPGGLCCRLKDDYFCPFGEGREGK